MNNRNQPCECGSGKKSKGCCQSEAEKSKRYHEETARMLARMQEQREQRAREQSDYHKKDPENGPFTYRRSPALPFIAAIAASMAMGSRR